MLLLGLDADSFEDLFPKFLDKHCLRDTSSTLMVPSTVISSLSSCRVSEENAV
jgi:hypothetical protein